MSVHYTSKWPALIGICLLAFTAFLDFTIVNTALPFIQKAFKTDILTLQWITNIFSIVLSMTMIASGKLGDFLGRKRVFYFGVFFFGAAALLAGFAPSMSWLIFFRGVQALGASITFILASSLLSEVFPENERAWAIGIFGGITGAGLMLGPFFGGILIGLLDWRWVFWVNIPLIVIGFLCCWYSLKGASHREKEVHLDWKGFCLLIFGLGFFMVGTIAGEWIYIAIGAVCLGALIFLDWKKPHPLLHFALFKDPMLLLAAISCVIAGVVSYVFMFFDPLLLENVFYYSPYTIGFLIAIIPAAQVVISFSFKQWLKLGLANLFLLSILTPLIATVWHLFFDARSSMAVFIVPFILLGINWGLSNTAMITAVNQNVAPHKIGESIGTIATLWNIAGAILLALSTVIFDKENMPFLPSFRTVIGFTLSFLAVVASLAVWVRTKVSTKMK